MSTFPESLKKLTIYQNYKYINNITNIADEKKFTLIIRNKVDLHKDDDFYT